MSASAFVDESRRRNLYIVTVVEVDGANVDTAQRCVRELARRGSQRTHFSAEGDGRRKTILGRYAELGAEGLIAARVITALCQGGDEQSARNLCLRQVIADCATSQVSRLVLDSRTNDRDRLDRQAIASAVRASPGIPDDFVYCHMSSRDEPLLSLPDAIGWAWGAGGEWRRTVNKLVDAVTDCAG